MIKSLPHSIFSILMFVTAALPCLAGDGTTTQSAHRKDAPGMNELSLHNAALSLTLDPVTGRINVARGKTLWQIAATSPTLARLSAEGKEYGVGGQGGVPLQWQTLALDTLTGQGKLPDLDVTCRISLQLPGGPVLRCRLDLTGADTGKITQVVFPPSPVLKDPAARLVVPQWLGLLVEPSGEDMQVRRNVWQRPWCMRFIGGSQPAAEGEQSYIAIAADSLYRGVNIWRKGGRLGFEYVGERSWSEQKATSRTQTLDFEFLDGNYVAIAHRYRQWMEGQPQWRTFATRERPLRLDRIGGAQFFAHIPCDYGGATIAFDDFVPRLEALRNAGIERAIFHLGGWNRDGYDSHYPDILPANPSCGGNEGMGRLTDAIDRLGYMATPHDDVAFMSEETPLFDQKWIARLPDGNPVVRTDIYRKQINYLASGAGMAQFARRNAPQIRKLFPNMHGYLYDVSTSVPPLEDYSASPPVLKADDIAARREAFKICREQFAEFMIGESIVDWAIDVYDAGFMAEEGYYHRGDGGWIDDGLHGVIVPIWELVYHDSVIAVREAPNYNKVNTDLETEDQFVRYLRLFLKTLRAGTIPPCIYSDTLTLNIMNGIKREGKAVCPGWSDLDTTQTLVTVSRLSTWLADSVFNEPMIDHEFVGGNLYHERTQFGGAKGPTTVYINTALEPWSPMPGLTLPALGFYITGPRLLAYYATEVAGHRFTQPTLAAFNDVNAADAGKRLCYRAFGDAAVVVVRDSKAVPMPIAQTGKTVRVAQ